MKLPPVHGFPRPGAPAQPVPELPPPPNLSTPTNRGGPLASQTDTAQSRHPSRLPPMSVVFPHTFVPWFRAVAPYAHAYRCKTLVVAIAGKLVAALR